jgi:hypothetical protein
MKQRSLRIIVHDAASHHQVTGYIFGCCHRK